MNPKLLPFLDANMDLPFDVASICKPGEMVEQSHLLKFLDPLLDGFEFADVREYLDTSNHTAIRTGQSGC